ncbi:hypothetical protein AMECASPLE_038806, partial [Ameca splendens]
GEPIESGLTRLTCKRAACLCLINAPLFRTMTTTQETKELFRRADAVCFDVDSTVIKEEGIDELAIFCGVGDAVREMYGSCFSCTLLQKSLYPFNLSTFCHTTTKGDTFYWDFI